MMDLTVWTLLGMGSVALEDLEICHALGSVVMNMYMRFDNSHPGVDGGKELAEA